MSERELFEASAAPILGDNPNWRESGNCELMWFAWQAARTQPATPDKMREALQLGLDAAEQVLADRKQALAGYPHKWLIEQEVVDTIRAALATPAQQGEPVAPVVPATQHVALMSRIALLEGLLRDWLVKGYSTARDAQTAEALAAAPQPEPLPTVQQVRQPLDSPLRKFLDAAAGEGFVLDGVDAQDLYLSIFGPPPEAAHGITGEQQ